MTPSFRSSAYIAIFLLILSGFQFGYQMALTGPFLLFITKEIPFSIFEQSVLSSCLVLGALLGSIAIGPIADSLGRKKSLFICLMILLAGSFMTSMGVDPGLLYLGRFLSGMGIGAISLVSSMLLSEMSPEGIRGKVVSINQLMITAGSFTAFVVGFLLREVEDWRLLTLLAAVPVALQTAMYWLIPESPAWHRTRQLHEKAEQTLTKIRKDLLWKTENTGISSDANKTAPSLLKGSGKKALIMGMTVHFFQQITGINAIIFFAPQIFTKAGFTGDASSLLAAVSLGVINILSTILAIVLIERLGRKFLLLLGSGLMAVSISGLALAFAWNPSFLPVLAISCALLFCAGFSVGLGPMAWVLISEIFHPKNKGKAMGICLFVNWLTAYLVTFFFLDLSQSIGSNAVFALFGGFSFLTFFYVYKKVPETKGKSHEEIEKILQPTQE